MLIASSLFPFLYNIHMVAHFVDPASSYLPQNKPTPTNCIGLNLFLIVLCLFSAEYQIINLKKG